MNLSAKGVICILLKRGTTSNWGGKQKVEDDLISKQSNLHVGEKGHHLQMGRETKGGIWVYQRKKRFACRQKGAPLPTEEGNKRWLMISSVKEAMCMSSNRGTTSYWKTRGWKMNFSKGSDLHEGGNKRWKRNSSAKRAIYMSPKRGTTSYWKTKGWNMNFSKRSEGAPLPTGEWNKRWNTNLSLKEAISMSPKRGTTSNCRGKQKVDDDFISERSDLHVTEQGNHFQLRGEKGATIPTGEGNKKWKMNISAKKAICMSPKRGTTSNWREKGQDWI